MESVATESTLLWRGSLRRVNAHVAATWTLALGLVLYLGFAGGGYDIIVSSQVGILLWWAILVGAAWGLLPAGRAISRAALAAITCFGAFAAWSALATTWSLSSELSLQEFSRVASYLAVLLLGLAIHRDRERALRHTVNAVAVGISVIAIFAVISRLVPGSFPASHVTAAFLPGAQQRLGWPLNYWNGLAALMAVALPLVLAVATSARTVAGQALGAAAIPVLALCGYLTFSRGGLAEGVAGLIVFLALAPQRLPKLATAIAGAAGSSILILGAIHRSAVENGSLGHTASVQGHQLLVTVFLVSLGTGLVQAGIGLAARHAGQPGFVRVSRRSARGLLAASFVALVVVAIAAGAPSHLVHAWNDFKTNGGPTGSNASRFGSVSGQGRYSYWKVALEATASRRWAGSGPGTFQLLWDPRATFYSPAINAHSLYIETLATVGVIGLALLVGFLVLIVVAAVRTALATESEDRTRAAAAAGAFFAFLVAAAIDWVWELPVLPAVLMLLASAVLAPAVPRVSVRRTVAADPSSPPAAAVSGLRSILVRVAVGAAAIACLIGSAVPLAAASDVRKSQAAVTAGDTTLALTDAQSAQRVEPDAASPDVQLALVYELRGDLPLALADAQRAINNEPLEWSSWLILSRLEAEAGNAKASAADYSRARSLDPRSAVFQNG